MTDDARPTPPPTTGSSCDGCALAGRRAFLRDVLALTAGAMSALGLAPDVAAALPLRVMTAVGGTRAECRYDMPAEDGVSVDREQAVILARWDGAVYAMSLACPHRGAALTWLPLEGRIECPRHQSRYRPDGVFLSGRATRALDRFPIRRDADAVVVNLETWYQQDQQPDAWARAFVPAGGAAGASR